MAEYYVGWRQADNPDVDMLRNREPKLFRVYQAGRPIDPLTEPLSREEAQETMRRIKLLDQPAQKELDLWQ